MIHNYVCLIYLTTIFRLCLLSLALLALAFYLGNFQNFTRNTLSKSDWDLLIGNGDSQFISGHHTFLNHYSWRNMS